VAGRAFGQTDTEDDVLNLVGVDAGSRDGVLDGVTRHRRAVGLVECAAEGPTDRGPRR